MFMWALPLTQPPDSLLVHLPAVLQQSSQKLLLQVIGASGESPDQVMGEHHVHPQAHLLEHKAVGQKGITLPSDHNMYLQGWISNWKFSLYL